MAGDITIKIGGKSTVGPDAIEPSIRALSRLGDAVSSVKMQAKGFATLWGFQRIAAGFGRLLGNLDEIGDRLGGQLGAQAHQASTAWGELRDELRGVTDEIAGRLAPHLTVLADEVKGIVSGSGARNSLGDWAEEAGNKISNLAEQAKTAASAISDFFDAAGSMQKRGKDFGLDAMGRLMQFTPMGMVAAPGLAAWNAADGSKPSGAVESAKRRAAIDMWLKAGAAGAAGAAGEFGKEKGFKDVPPKIGIRFSDDDPNESSRTFDFSDQIQKVLDEDQRRKDIADALRDRNMTPLERMRKEMAEAEDLRKRDLISDQDLARERRRLTLGVAGNRPDFSAPGLQGQEGSFLSRGRGVKVDEAAQMRWIANQQLQVTDKTLKYAEASARALENIERRIAAGGEGLYGG